MYRYTRTADDFVQMHVLGCRRASSCYRGHVKRRCNGREGFRAVQDGEVQLWGVEDHGLLHSMQIGQGLRVSTLAVFRDQPYVLLGCEDGSIRVRLLPKA